MKKTENDAPKHVYEGGVIVSVRDKIGVVEELGSSAFQRRHFRQNPTRIDLVHGHILIFGKLYIFDFFSCT